MDMQNEKKINMMATKKCKTVAWAVLASECWPSNHSHFSTQLGSDLGALFPFRLTNGTGRVEAWLQLVTRYWFCVLASTRVCYIFKNPQQSGNVLTTKEMDLSHDL